MFADRLSDDTVQTVIDLLFVQLKSLMENTNKLIHSMATESTSEVSVSQKRCELSQDLKQTEAALCYFITFLRRVAVTKVAQNKLVSSSWIALFMDIVSFTSNGEECTQFGLRTRVLTLHLLTFVLPACEDGPLIETVSIHEDHILRTQNIDWFYFLMLACCCYTFLQNSYSGDQAFFFLIPR